MIDVIPSPTRFLAGAVIIALGLAGSGAAGWFFNGWRKDAVIAELQRAHAQERADQARAALTMLQADAAAIHKAATEFGAIQSTLAPKMTALTKELRNAKPLPADCRPDVVRVRNLDAAIDAANQGIPR